MAHRAATHTNGRLQREYAGCGVHLERIPAGVPIDQQQHRDAAGVHVAVPRAAGPIHGAAFGVVHTLRPARAAARLVHAKITRKRFDHGRGQGLKRKERDEYERSNI